MNKTLIFFALLLTALSASTLISSRADDNELRKSFLNGHFSEGFAGSFLASQYARRSGDFESSAEYLKNAYEKSPDDLDLAKQLEGTLLLAGHVDDAVKIAKVIYAAKPDDAVSALLLSLEAEQSGDSEKSLSILNTSFKTSDGQLWLPLVKAWLELKQKTLKKPVQIGSIKSATGRAAMIVHYHLALVNDMAGFESAAVTNFQSAAAEENPPVRVMQALYEFYERNKKPAKLKPIVETYLAQHPDFAREDIAVHNVHEGIAEVLFTMGSIMLSANLNQDAIIYLRLALYLKPDFPLVQLTLGDCYSDMEQYASANEIYSHINSSHRLYKSAQINQAVNYHRMGDISKAVELLDKLAENKDSRYLALVTKGDILRENLRFENAVNAYSDAINMVGNLESQHWGLLFARGASQERLKNWNQAEQDLEKALKLSNDQPEVLNYLGYLWLERGQHVDQAKKMINRAFDQRPNDPQIMDSMGWAYYLTGEYGKAATLLEKAVDLIPSDPTVNNHLGDVYWQQGRKTEARFQWERSLTFAPDPDEAEAIRRKLKEGVNPPDIVSNMRNEPPVVASQQIQGQTTP